MFIPWDESVRGESKGGILNRKPSMNGLLNFVQSPQALALATGLLEGGQPSFDYSPSLGAGLARGFNHMQAANKFERKQGLEEEKLRQMSELDRAKLEIAKARLALDRDKANNPGMDRLTGLPQEYASLMAIKERFGEDSYAYQEARRALEMRLKTAESMVNTRNEVNSRRDWTTLPVDYKVNVLAQYASLGINEKDAIALYNAGRSPQDIAMERQNVIPEEDIGDTPPAQVGEGFPPPPKEMPIVGKEYAATGATRTSIQRAEGGLAEEEYIAPIIKDAMAPYARKFAGYSPRQMLDALSSDPDKIDKIAKFYAARAIQPEIAGNRARMTDTSTAEGAMHDIQSSALNKVKILESEVSPEAYAKASDYISEWISGMTRSRVDAMKGIKRPKTAKKADDDPLGLRKK